jgi:hypothetical protein
MKKQSLLIFVFLCTLFTINAQDISIEKQLLGTWVADMEVMKPFLEKHLLTDPDTKDLDSTNQQAALKRALKRMNLIKVKFKPKGRAVLKGFITPYQLENGKWSFNKQDTILSVRDQYSMETRYKILEITNYKLLLGKKNGFFISLKKRE